MAVTTAFVDPTPLPGKAGSGQPFDGCRRRGQGRIRTPAWSAPLPGALVALSGFGIDLLPKAFVTQGGPLSPTLPGVQSVAWPVGSSLRLSRWARHDGF